MGSGFLLLSGSVVVGLCDSAGLKSNTPHACCTTHVVRLRTTQLYAKPPSHTHTAHRVRHTRLQRQTPGQGLLCWGLTPARQQQQQQQLSLDCQCSHQHGCHTPPPRAYCCRQTTPWTAGYTTLRP
jgi:hypothetical protein